VLLFVEWQSNYMDLISPTIVIQKIGLLVEVQRQYLYLGRISVFLFGF
jgi:hypothetical protein